MDDYEKPRAYYVAAGRSLKAIQDWSKASEVKLSEWNRFERKHRGKMLYQQNWDGSKTPSAMDFKGREIPSGWRVDRKTGLAKPALNTPTGKRIAKDFQAMSTPKLDDAIGKAQMFGLRMCSPGIHQIGDKWIIVHHADAEPPLDAKRLKTSQYFAMKEKVEAREHSPSPA